MMQVGNSMPPKKDDDFTNFTFRFDRALREAAEKLAGADERPLGVWIHRLIAREVEAHAPTPPRKRGK